MPKTNNSTNTTPAKPRARSTRAPREQPNAVTDRQAKSGNGQVPVLAGSQSHNPSYDEIAEEAYQRYLRRGGQHGQDFDDWLEAERALKAKRS